MPPEKTNESKTTQSADSQSGDGIPHARDTRMSDADVYIEGISNAISEKVLRASHPRFADDQTALEKWYDTQSLGTPISVLLQVSQGSTETATAYVFEAPSSRDASKDSKWVWYPKPSLLGEILSVQDAIATEDIPKVVTWTGIQSFQSK
ncbi:hypothetical protein I302_105401 [Kwoniella bestiolae CBS 10118]|uniref:Uncharacterized protein n=1 Tax=Kwoniella bestiolae CBS 10118 TaxID=1296100 RepID=A0A1B9FT15_9TREE|nr:hypothetical protein I302_08682 [Kwoniella bestiolae CBS 10118]OCF21903.1 hypothetical protein I302_08682 [Kwoniella bestiolae CBS 10118]